MTGHDESRSESPKTFQRCESQKLGNACRKHVAKGIENIIPDTGPAAPPGRPRYYFLQAIMVFLGLLVYSISRYRRQGFPGRVFFETSAPGPAGGAAPHADRPRITQRSVALGLPSDWDKREEHPR